MADFAPNYTARYRMRYTSLSKNHALTWRVLNTVTDPAAVAAKMELFLADMEGRLWTDFTVVGADFALADSDVFLPCVAPASPTGAATTNPAYAAHAADAISFVSRSAAGGKGRFFLYGTNYGRTEDTAEQVDWRITSGEDATIAAGVARLNETSPSLVCNDNHVAVWYEYANFKPNDRWIRRLRRG